MQTQLVSIIIITRNRPFLLKHCLQHVIALPYTHKEIIVVDSSTNDESQAVLACYPEIINLRLRGERNNMPAARNRGIALSSGDILAFIDDDSMVFPGWLDALLAAYSDETVGAVGGRIVRKREPYCEELSGPPRLVVEPGGVVIAKDLALVSYETLEVDHLIGCNMSFRRKALEQVGGFDSYYTLTNLREETDLCVRVKKAGWRILYVPEMTVVHISARSKEYFTDLPGIQFSNGRNTMYFAIKHFGLTPATLLRQAAEFGRSCGRAAFLTGVFTSGVVAQLAGRMVGLVVGISWLVSKQRRVAAAPGIGGRPQKPRSPSLVSEQRERL